MQLAHNTPVDPSAQLHAVAGEILLDVFATQEVGIKHWIISVVVVNGASLLVNIADAQ